jgi:hypothetical protein
MIRTFRFRYLYWDYRLKVSELHKIYLDWLINDSDINKLQAKSN